MVEDAAVGWTISAFGWIALPITSRLLSDCFAFLGFDNESKKLRDLEARLLPQLALMREEAERIPPGQRPHAQLWANRLREAFYDAEDILDVADYHRLQKQVNFLFMWIHVSQSFSVGKVFQEMLEAASGEPSHEFCNLNTLQEKLEGKLKCKRYFLVLDDIWAGKDVGVHEYKLNQLLSPLESGKKGSMVLVTTQFKDAAKSLGAHGPMRIPDLNETDLFDLFMHFALDGANLDAQELETFQMIGKQIVKKLKGHI